MDRSCQSFVDPIEELQQAGSNVLLAWVPHKKTHGPMAIIKKMLEATMNVIKSRALKNIVPLITHMHAWAERADAGNPCHAQPPAHLNGQRVSTKPEMKTSAACICHLWATESMALAPDLCVQISGDTCTPWPLLRGLTQGRYASLVNGPDMNAGLSS